MGADLLQVSSSLEESLILDALASKPTYAQPSCLVIFIWDSTREEVLDSFTTGMD
jgi:hypothetical protein